MKFSTIETLLKTGHKLEIGFSNDVDSWYAEVTVGNGRRVTENAFGDHLVDALISLEGIESGKRRGKLESRFCDTIALTAIARMEIILYVTMRRGLYQVKFGVPEHARPIIAQPTSEHLLAAISESVAVLFSTIGATHHARFFGH